MALQHPARVNATIDGWAFHRMRPSEQSPNGVPYFKKGGYKVKREHNDTEYARSRRSKGIGGSQGSKGERADAAGR